ncbi:MAG: response regulator [Candidatus Latescibacterota bacterium]
MTDRVLVVDDNPTNLKLACDVLQAEGYAVEQAEEAEGALAAIRARPPDLILMDVALPGKDGFSLTRELKEDPATRHIPVIALTAFAMRGDDEKARQAGCDGYIPKPVDTRKLPVQVADVLARSRRRR